MTERRTVFERAEQAIYERSGKRDEPEDSFGRIADFWSTYLGYDVDPVDVADMMILLKMARSSGGHYERDNWADVTGYAFHADRLYAKERGEWRGSCSNDESTDEVVYEDGTVRVTENDIHRP